MTLQRQVVREWYIFTRRKQVIAARKIKILDLFIIVFYYSESMLAVMLRY